MGRKGWILGWLIGVGSACSTSRPPPEQRPPVPPPIPTMALAQPEPIQPESEKPVGPVLPSLRPDQPLVLDQLPESDTAATVARADAAVDREEAEQALALLPPGDPSAAVALVRARALRQLGRLKEAEGALSRVALDPVVAPLGALEAGQLALSQNDPARAVTELTPFVAGPPWLAHRASLLLLDALTAIGPAAVLEQAPTLASALPPDDLDARSQWLAALARAHAARNETDAARALLLQQYLEEPVSSLTPDAPPEGTRPRASQLLQRAERLLAAHRNERVVSALSALSTQELSAEEKCRRRFALGLAHRKLRHYASAEKHLTAAVNQCADAGRVRRAMYLQAKVVSIRSGLRAVPIIEAFAERFAGHTMVDDVLFWAGDLLQRRRRWADARRYYERIESAPVKDDYCGEARWRLAWIAYRRGQLDAAEQSLARVLLDDGCAPARFDRARAQYWLARIHTQRGRKKLAIDACEQTLARDPLGFYGQLAARQLRTLAPGQYEQYRAQLRPEGQPSLPPLCPGFLAEDSGFAMGLALLARGLRSDAATSLTAIEGPEAEVTGPAHAVALGVAPQAPVHLAGDVAANTCHPDQAPLLWAMVLDRAGATQQAHWRLRTDFAEVLARRPTVQTLPIWRAAYPLAYRSIIARAETDSGLPEYLVQALAREESALDPGVVSWAGAYGLTQLLLSSGQRAGARLDPSVTITRAEELLAPELNVRLGATLLAAEAEKLGQHPGLALAAYNAGPDVAAVWWRRHGGQRFDVFAEEMTIKETRGYVKRVLKTFGIYRWLYGGAEPVLPVADRLPVRPAGPAGSAG